jgi:hypothetical protein
MQNLRDRTRDDLRCSKLWVEWKQDGTEGMCTDSSGICAIVSAQGKLEKRIEHA